MKILLTCLITALILKYAESNINKKISFIEEDESVGFEYAKFCRDLKCPKYKVMSKGDGYEERCYGETKWVVTHQKVHHYTPSSFFPMYNKLFKYRTGKNERHLRMEMTVPVIVSIILSPDDHQTLEAEMHFFVPPSNETLPQPISEDIGFVTYKPICYYVRSYGGWQLGINLRLKEERRLLAASLKKAGLKYVDGLLIYAGYDSPWRFVTRHNEVWLLKSLETIFSK